TKHVSEAPPRLPPPLAAGAVRLLTFSAATAAAPPQGTEYPVVRVRGAGGGGTLGKAGGALPAGQREAVRPRRRPVGRTGHRQAAHRATAAARAPVPCRHRPLLRPDRTAGHRAGAPRRPAGVGGTHPDASGTRRPHPTDRAGG